MRPDSITVVSDHRKLFSMLGTGWYQPKAPPWKHYPLMAGVGSDVIDPEDLAINNAIGCRLTFDSNKLPEVDVAIQGSKGDWIKRPFSEMGDHEGAMLWLGPLPSFALKSVDVSTTEKRDRLIGMSRATSNIDFDSVPVNRDASVEKCKRMKVPLDAELGHAFTIPSSFNAVAGALAMGATESKEQQNDGALPPWLLKTNIASERHVVPADFDECMWIASRNSFRSNGIHRPPPRHQVLRIAEKAVALASGRFADDVWQWRNETTNILDMNAVYKDDTSIPCPVGTAVQIVLCRNSGPHQIESWLRETKATPGLRMATALLSGLNFGYVELPTHLRGDAMQRESILSEAMRSLNPSVLWDDEVGREPLPSSKRDSRTHGVSGR